MNAHVDKLRETSTKYAQGWNLDNINQINPGSKYHRWCPGRNSWYGWASGHPKVGELGSISTKLSGCGVAKLDFGECYASNSAALVKVNLNGAEIGRATAGQISKTIEFGFKDGNILELIEGNGSKNSSLIRFNSFTVISCC